MTEDAPQRDYPLREVLSTTRLQLVCGRHVELNQAGADRLPPAAPPKCQPATDRTEARRHAASHFEGSSTTGGGASAVRSLLAGGRVSISLSLASAVCQRRLTKMSFEGFAESRFRFITDAQRRLADREAPFRKQPRRLPQPPTRQVSERWLALPILPLQRGARRRRHRSS